MSKFLKGRQRIAWQPICWVCACCLPIWSSKEVLFGERYALLYLMKGKHPNDWTSASNWTARGKRVLYPSKKSSKKLTVRHLYLPGLPKYDAITVHSAPTIFGGLGHYTVQSISNLLPVVMFYYFFCLAALSDPVAKESCMLNLLLSLPEPNLVTFLFLLDHLKR